MPLEAIRVSDVLPVPPDRLYSDFLNSAVHAAFSGGEAEIAPRPGGAFSAWDGYITGTTLELAPGRRILQRWRSSDFPEKAADSLLEVLFEPEGAGTRLTFVHSQIPEGQGAEYERGWQDYYFTPMKAYYA